MLKPSLTSAVLSRVTTVMLYAALVMLIATTLLVVAQVICRNFFDLGLPWADELARFCGMSLVFLAIPRLLFDDKHIAMDMIPALLPRAAQSALGVVNRLLALAFCAILLWAIYKFLYRAWKISTPALGIPNYIYYLPAIIGFALFAAVTLHRLFHPPVHDKPILPEPDA